MKTSILLVVSGVSNSEPPGLLAMLDNDEINLATTTNESQVSMKLAGSLLIQIPEKEIFRAAEETKLFVHGVKI